MKTDESIAQEKAFLEPLLGPTRSGWYEEACKLEIPDTPHEVMIWACRFREMAMEAGKLADALMPFGQFWVGFPYKAMTHWTMDAKTDYQTPPVETCKRAAELLFLTW